LKHPMQVRFRYDFMRISLMKKKGVYDKETGELNLNPNSLVETSAYVEPELLKAKGLEQLSSL